MEEDISGEKPGVCCDLNEGSLNVSLDTSQLILGAVLMGVVGGVVAAVANTAITAALVFLIS